MREEEDEGVEEGEEPRYMVDFTRKIWEEVMCTCTCRNSTMYSFRDVQ